MAQREGSTEIGSQNTDMIRTTIGELIEALTQVAIEAGNSEQEGYRLASLALSDMLRQRARGRRSSGKSKKIN